jgi:Peptidase S24-like
MQAPLANADLKARQETQIDLVTTTLHEFGEVRLLASGCSMIPFICPGDLLTVRCIPLSHADVGDIVLSSRERRFCVHRLLRSWSQGDQSYFQTKGDALLQPDPVAWTGQFLGRVTTIERQGKQVGSHRGIWNSCIAAVVRRSEFATKVFLHCHSARIRSYSSPTVAGGTDFGNFLESL